MLLQIVVIFRISLQFACIFGCLMGFSLFSHGDPFFSFIFHVEEERENAQTRVAKDKSIPIKNDINMQ